MIFGVLIMFYVEASEILIAKDMTEITTLIESVNTIQTSIVGASRT